MQNNNDNNDFNSISSYEVVYDRYGKKHKIFSVRFKDVQTVTKFTEKYNSDCYSIYLLAPVMDEDGNVEERNGETNYDNGFYDDLMEIIELALDGRETREQINEWLDMAVAKKIVETFLGISSFKKKATAIKELIGEMSSQALFKTQA